MLLVGMCAAAGQMCKLIMNQDYIYSRVANVGANEVVPGGTQGGLGQTQHESLEVRPAFARLKMRRKGGKKNKARQGKSKQTQLNVKRHIC